MASEGPYSVVGHPHGGVGIVGPGNDGSYCGMARYQAEEFVGNLNKAYAEGRKAAEEFYFGDELPNNTKIFIKSSGRVVRIILGEGYFEQNNQEAAQRILISEMRKAITINREAAEKEARGIE
jgi:hypothetical protein